MRNFVGLKFGRLTVLRREGRDWFCVCDCGKERVTATALLSTGRTKSCGCLQVEVGRARGKASARHGESTNGRESTEYRAWAAMKSRCRNPNHQLWPEYGGRGIQLCERWDSYENFLSDMGRRPPSFGAGRGRAFSLDRIDNNGDYCPENCRWATSSQQNSNRRSSRVITAGGVTQGLADWLKETGVNRRTFYRRVAQGLSDVEALGLHLGSTSRRDDGIGANLGHEHEVIE